MKTVKDVKEKLNKDIEKSQNKKETETLETESYLSQIKNTVESHSSKLEQVENRISELKDKIDIKGRTE
jgi:chromosome segregation ATPase